MIQAEVICDSINEFGNRITSMVVEFPRYILAEFNTHRIFSRNSASSRAIPFSKMVRMVSENSFIPVAFMKEHKGMQGSDYITDQTTIDYIKHQYMFAIRCNIDAAERMSSNDLTKQMCNRLLEPFMWHKVLVTATEWDNFFELRCPQYEYTNKMGKTQYFKSKKEHAECQSWNFSDEEGNDFGQPIFVPSSELDWMKINKGGADIHMMMLAEAMWDAMNESKPKLLKAGEWHLPYGDKIDEAKFDFLSKEQVHDTNSDQFVDLIEMTKVKIATARCARTSFNNFDGTSSSYEKDIELHDKLVIQKPIHASPAEHCSRCMNGDQYYANIKEYIGNDGMVVTEYGWLRNFRGWIQYRTMIDQK